MVTGVMSMKIAGADPEAREFLRNADPVLARIIDIRFRSRADGG